MWWILLLSCWPYPLSWSLTWYSPAALNTMLGEQVDLVGAINTTSGWTKNTANNEDFNDAVNGSESDINPGQPSIINSVDREPLDEVERIEPRQWPSRPDILPTRSTAPFTTETSLSPKSPQPTTLAQRHPSTQRYPTVTVPPPTVTVDEVFCDFGPVPSMPLCEWQNGNGALEWTPGTGMGTNWLGGPSIDATSSTMDGGYAFLETSQVASKDLKFKSPGGLLHSPQLGSTGVAGTCFMFKYTMDGLSIAGLRVLLHIGMDEFSFKKEETEELPIENITTAKPCESVEVVEERVLWHAQYYMLGVWQQAQILYTYPELHSVIIEGIPVDSTDPSRLYRGYIAIDDIDLQSGTSCVGFCNFAGGFCDWNNDAEDDFDWTIVDECDWINSRDPDRVEWERVSTQVLGPRNQRKPYSNGHTVNRRNEYFLGLGRLRGASRSSGGGTAQLVSREMKGTEEPLCITFWYFMFEPFIDSTGPSLGVLRLYLQTVGDISTEAKPIWQLYNNQGPTWNYAQANINENTNFNIVLEGTWGPNRASGSIGIDDISFYTGNCSVKPLSAAVRAEDCSFEKDLCGWENITVSDNDRAVMWQRAFQTHRPAQLLDRTFGATGDFVFFDIFTTNKQSTKVKLRSPIIDASPDEEFMCFTFWFAAFGVEESTALRVIKMLSENADENEDEQEQLLWSLTAKGFNNPRPVWMPAQVTIEARTPYRLILEGSASNGGFAVDDIKFQPLACATRPAPAQPIVNET
ncbi:hypothetical protein ACFW04_002935 [Cataglyphis niger]